MSCAVGDEVVDGSEDDVDTVSPEDVSSSSGSSDADVSTVLNSCFAAALAADEGNTFSKVLRKVDQLQDAVVNLSSKLEQVSGELKAMRRENAYLNRCLKNVTSAV